MKVPAYFLSPIGRQHILGIIHLFEKPTDTEKWPGSVDRGFIQIPDLVNARHRSVTNKST